MATNKLTKEEIVNHLKSAGISEAKACAYADEIIKQEVDEPGLFMRLTETTVKDLGFSIPDRIKFIIKFGGIYSILFDSILFYSILFYSIRFYSILF